MNQSLKFFFSKRKLLKLILISTLINMIGYLGIQSDNSFFYVVGILNLFIGSTCFLIGVYHLFHLQPVMTLTNEGVYHKQITKRIIPWEVILKAEVIQHKNQELLSLSVKRNFDLKSNLRYLFKKTANFSQEQETVNMNITQLNVNRNSLTNFLIQRI